MDVKRHADPGVALRRQARLKLCVGIMVAILLVAAARSIHNRRVYARAVVMARLRERWPEAEIGMEAGEGEARFVIRLGKGGAGLDEAVFQAVVEAGAVMTDLRHERESLEDVFKRLTGGGRA